GRPGGGRQAVYPRRSTHPPIPSAALRPRRVHHSALHQRRKGVPNDRDRLHGRAPPVGVRLRGAGAIPSREGLPSASSAPGREALMSTADEQSTTLDPQEEAWRNGLAPAIATTAPPRAGWSARL